MTEDLPEYWHSRWLLERSLALIYLVAFLVALNQFVPLLGEHGLLPVPRFVSAVPFSASPSLFFSSRRIGHSRAPHGPGSSFPWLPSPGWRSGATHSWLVQYGRRSGPSTCRSPTSARRSTASAGNRCCSKRAFSRYRGVEQHRTTPVSQRDLSLDPLSGLMFGAGLIKIRGDSCWRDLTCLDTTSRPSRSRTH